MFKFIKRVLYQNKAVDLLNLNYKLCNGVQVRVANGSTLYPFAQWLVIYFWRFNQEKEHHFFSVKPFTLGMMALYWHISEATEEDSNTVDCARVLGQMTMQYKMNKDTFPNYDKKILDKLLIDIEENL